MVNKIYKILSIKENMQKGYRKMKAITHMEKDKPDIIKFEIAAALKDIVINFDLIN